jgi:hypothetical protein
VVGCVATFAAATALFVQFRMLGAGSWAIFQAVVYATINSLFAGLAFAAGAGTGRLLRIS